MSNAEGTGDTVNTTDLSNTEGIVTQRALLTQLPQTDSHSEGTVDTVTTELRANLT